MYALIDKLNTAIKWSFYLLFFTIPLVMWPSTFELFEFNKMWVVFGISIFIFFLWATKMVVQGKIEIRRTPLDIPIVLFLISQIISTIISIDPHTSLWGYYSRFNGGLFSTISYIFLYYAYVSNLIPTEEKEQKSSYKTLGIILLSGVAVTIWGLPGHFGYDPTCLVFRGTLDVACWTDQFQPTVRIFSTLGQPNWLGTFLGALIPVMAAFGLKNVIQNPEKLNKSLMYLSATFLFFLALLYTRSQSSFLGLGFAMIVFIALFAYKSFKDKQINFEKVTKQKHTRFVIATVLIFVVTVFFAGTPIPFLNKYTTLEGLRALTTHKSVAKIPTDKSDLQSSDIQLGGTDSSKIRLIVWRGAIEIFKSHPLFGTGVETFAYAYYKVKPVEHNLTSEWDYLYNKAHNEYLNLLATTGIFGLATYMLVVLYFLYRATLLILSNKPNKGDSQVLIGITCGYIAILISDFFGFSVVPINLLFFLFPAIFFEIADPKIFKNLLALPRADAVQKRELGMGRMFAILVIACIAIYFEFYLVNFWVADRSYALGYNLDKASEYSQAFTPLSDAVKALPSEDLYKDEQSINLATLAIVLAQNNRATEAAQLAQQANAISDKIIAAHPNNIVFYKTRIRVQYALTQLDPRFIDNAINTAKVARTLAPTDAKLAYNLALFYNQKGDNDKMIELLNTAKELKPNYFDPYYAKALLDKDLAKNNPTKAAEYQKDELENVNYILKNIDPGSQQAKDLLKQLQ